MVTLPQNYPAGRNEDRQRVETTIYTRRQAPRKPPILHLRKTGRAFAATGHANGYHK